MIVSPFRSFFPGELFVEIVSPLSSSDLSLLIVILTLSFPKKTSPTISNICNIHGVQSWSYIYMEAAPLTMPTEWNPFRCPELDRAIARQHRPRRQRRQRRRRRPRVRWIPTATPKTTATETAAITAAQRGGEGRLKFGDSFDVIPGEIPEPDHDEPEGVIPVSGDDSPAIYEMLALADENENVGEMYSSKQMITTTVAENAKVVSDDHETPNPKIVEEEVLATEQTCPSAWTIAKFATKFPQVFKTFAACLQGEGLPTRVLADLGLFTRLARRGEQT